MPTTIYVTLAGLAVSLGGTVVLAVSLNSLLRELALTANAHDLTIQQVTDPNADVVVFTGLDTHLARGATTARRWTLAGIVLVGLGTALQSVGLVLTVLK